MVTLKHSNKPKYKALINDKLRAFNASVTGRDDSAQLILLAHDEEANVPVGGLIALIWLNTLWIETLFLDEEFRGRGIGSDLLERAEKEAKQQGCNRAEVQTFSFQALPFYQKMGYKIFGLLQDVAGYDKYYLEKEL